MHAERPGAPRLELAHEVGQGQARVDDVLDHHDVATADVGAEVVQDLHPPGVGSEPRDRHEVELYRYLRDRPGEVGHEDEGALQDTDEHDPVGMVPLDLTTQPRDECGDGVGVEQDRRGHVSP